jgi:peptidoglycan/LPS O-acetylase OafA/YrhL
MGNERIYYLNGLRGILAIIVFIHHYLYAFYPDLIFGGTREEVVANKHTLSWLIAYTPLNAAFNPGLAISFFFLLSGYVQAYHYIKTEDPIFLQRSFIKRYFRLALPVLTVVLLLYLFHRLHLIRKEGIPYHELSSGWSKSMLPDDLNFLQLFNYVFARCFNGDSSYYQILWTMSPELYNSWMVIILLMVTHRIRNKMPLLLAWLAFQCVFLQSFYSASFTLGLMLSHLNLKSPAFNAFASKPLVKLLCLLMGLYFASYPFTGYEGVTQRTIYGPISFFDTIPHVISFAFGNLLLFIFMMHSARAKKILAWPTLLFFGEISFMFYLVHFLIIFSFSPRMYQFLQPYLVTTANAWLTGLASFVMVTLASWVLYLCVDKPVVRLCNVYTKKLFGI